MSEEIIDLVDEVPQITGQDYMQIAMGYLEQINILNVELMVRQKKIDLLLKKKE